MAVNAFCLIWNNNYFYNLPPFSLGPVLAKVNREMTETVIVVPDWSTQYWYSQLMQMTNHEPLYFRPVVKHMILPDKPFTTSKTAVNDNKVNDATAKILETSWRKSTHFKYNNYTKQWLCYSRTMGKIGVTHVLDFLSGIFDKKHSSSMCYSSCSYTTLRFVK